MLPLALANMGITALQGIVKNRALDKQRKLQIEQIKLNEVQQKNQVLDSFNESLKQSRAVLGSTNVMLNQGDMNSRSSVGKDSINQVENRLQGNKQQKDRNISNIDKTSKNMVRSVNTATDNAQMQNVVDTGMSLGSQIFNSFTGSKSGVTKFIDFSEEGINQKGGSYFGENFKYF